MKEVTLVVVILGAVVLFAVLVLSIMSDATRDSYQYTDQEPQTAACDWDNCEPAPTIINHNLYKHETLDDIMVDLFDKYAPDREYRIGTKTGSEVYVCSHYGCDMATNLIGGGYNAGVVINHNDLHALTWVEIDDQFYVIEPQTSGKYWTVEDYDDGQNIDVVSLQKGREHAKSSSEGLHN